MSAARIERRLLRKMLKGATCTACSGALDETAHRAFWFDQTGTPVPHLVCSTCMQRAQHSQEAADEVASKCALALCEPGGHA
jgi:hypothetical protein